MTEPGSAYQCSACARSLARAVKYCPYCGASQQVHQQAQPAPAADIAPVSAAPAPVPAPVPVPVPTTPPVQAAAAAAPTPTPTQEPEPSAPPPQSPPPPPPDVHKAADKQGKPNLNKPIPVKVAPPAGPKKKIPWFKWSVYALLVYGLWRCFGPSDHLSEANQETVKAVKTLIDECKLDRARQEAAMLRKPEPERYRDLLQSIDAAKPACDNKRQREQDWLKTQAIANKTINDSHFDKPMYDKAAGRLNWFQKHWSEDDGTRELKSRLDARYTRLLLDQAESCMADKNINCVKARLGAWEKFKPAQGRERVQALQEALAEIASASKASSKASVVKPVGTPTPKPGVGTGTSTSTVTRTASGSNAAAGAAPATTQQVNKILADAQAEMNYGNYKGASDKLEFCISMIDKGNAACAQLKKRADQLNRDMLRCVNSGSEWMADHCAK